MVNPNVPREEVLKAFKALFNTPKKHITGTWSHRLKETDPDHAFGLFGEFGLYRDLAFERHLRNIYEHKSDIE